MDNRRQTVPQRSPQRANGVRDVSTALGKRVASADEVKDGLSKLSMIATWQGTGGDAARAALDKLSKHLAAHAEEMTAIAAATTKALLLIAIRLVCPWIRSSRLSLLWRARWTTP